MSFQLLAVILAVGGVVVISLDKEFGGSLLGIALATFCAVSAAFYKVGLLICVFLKFSVNNHCFAVFLDFEIF